MINIKLIFLLLFYSVSGYFFVEPNNLYSILIPDQMTLFKTDTLNNGEVNYIFVGDVIEEFEFEYSFSIALAEGKTKEILSSSAIEDYQSKYSCKVVSSSTFVFNNFEGVKSVIERSIEGIDIGGNIYMSTGNKRGGIIIGFMAPKSDLPKIDAVAPSILNTLVLNLPKDKSG